MSEIKKIKSEAGVLSGTGEILAQAIKNNNKRLFTKYLNKLENALENFTEHLAEFLCENPLDDDSDDFLYLDGVRKGAQQTLLQAEEFISNHEEKEASEVAERVSHGRARELNDAIEQFMQRLVSPSLDSLPDDNAKLRFLSENSM